MERKELKKLATEIIECNEDYQTTQEYLNALRSIDIDKINYFQAMGEDVRQQIMNVNDYKHGLLFGFDEIKFDEYGWLDNTAWKTEEEVEIKACAKTDAHHVGNSVRLAMGQNGIWTYGISCKLGSGCGVHWSPSVFDTPYKSKDQACQAGFNYILKKHQDALTHNDKVKYNHDYNKKVIAWISSEIKVEKQLELF
jgi:hypothetical protein